MAFAMANKRSENFEVKNYKMFHNCLSRAVAKRVCNLQLFFQVKFGATSRRKMTQMLVPHLSSISCYERCFNFSFSTFKFFRINEKSDF